LLSRVIGGAAPARPNPSLERTRNGKAPWPCDAFVYDAPHGQGALPPRAAQLKRKRSANDTLAMPNAVCCG
jgi:hypothetical protein